MTSMSRSSRTEPTRSCWLGRRPKILWCVVSVAAGPDKASLRRPPLSGGGSQAEQAHPAMHVAGGDRRRAEATGGERRRPYVEWSPITAQTGTTARTGTAAAPRGPAERRRQAPPVPAGRTGAAPSATSCSRPGRGDGPGSSAPPPSHWTWQQLQVQRSEQARVEPARATAPRLGGPHLDGRH
jgi:hypothetical protein